MGNCVEDHYHSVILILPQPSSYYLKLLFGQVISPVVPCVNQLLKRNNQPDRALAGVETVTEPLDSKSVHTH